MVSIPDTEPAVTKPGTEGNSFRNGNGEPPPEEIWAHRSTTNRQVSRGQPIARPLPGNGGNNDDVPLPFDPVRLLEAVKRKWFLCVLAGILAGAVGFSWYFLGQRSYVVVQLVRREMPLLFQAEEKEGGFRPQKYTDQALINLLQAPETVRRVAGKAQPPLGPKELAPNLLIWGDREAEMIYISFKGKELPRRAADLITLYGNEAVALSRELQTDDAKSLNNFIIEKLLTVNSELEKLNEEMRKIPAESRAIDKDKQVESYLVQLAELDTKYELARIELEASNPINDKLQGARDELANLLLKYTDEHPFVQQHREKIKLLEQQAESLKKTPAQRLAENISDSPQITSSLAQRTKLVNQMAQLKSLRESLKQKLESLATGDFSYALLKNRYQALEKIRNSLSSRQREAELFVEAAPGYLKLLAPATIDRVDTTKHVAKSYMFTILGTCLGFFGMMGLVFVREVIDDTVKTVADMERTTDLPILATLGNLDKMDAAAQRAWAFRTWTILKGKLDGSQTHGMVCGFISATHGEGRSTWIKLLSASANQRGLRVLTVTTRPTDEPAVHPHEPVSETDKENVNGQFVTTRDANNNEIRTLAPSVLAHPAQVEQQLAESNASSECPVVHIPLPGWVWNLERRKQWQDALTHWKQIENLVLLVELPPAQEPESILLAEKVPHLIWFAESGRVTMKETRQHLETLHHAGCNLVGTVLNREPESFWASQISRWFTIALTALLPFSAQAQETERPAGTPGSFSVRSTQRAEWQKNLTFGPGDIVNLGFFGDTNLTKNEIAIGPDGRISYLQATDVMATGLTVDQLRAAIDRQLEKYYRSPKSIVTPVAFRSKRYFVLGKVMNKGVFTLDRPITILEAIARAKGLETGMLTRNSIEMADLQRSFLVRHGQRIPVNFEKLFNEGDLSQNIPMEPDDYLYFPAANLREIYVVGEVQSPGVVTYTESTTVLSAIIERSGFNQKAYKGRVLVVRGSLNNPETFVVDTHQIVDGRNTDFQLQPKDIIYVNYRPFIRAEELFDLAVTGFIQSATTAWTGQHIGPIIMKPLIGGLP